MNITPHIQALVLTLSLYLFLGIACFGWGKLILRFISNSEHDNKMVYSFHMWTGWSVTLLVLQLIHLILPLDFYTVTPVFVLGILFAALFFVKCHKKKLSALPKYTIIKIIFLGSTLLIIATWLASRAMLAPEHYDTGLYHLSAIRWCNTFPIIPGLGNLHGRLAFNQSFFPYVAALNFYPFFNHGYAIANSSLVLLSFLTFFEIFLLDAENWAGNFQKNFSLQFLASLFCLPILIYWPLSQYGCLSSPSPDLTSGLMQLVLFIIFCNILDSLIKTGRAPRTLIGTILILSATAITVKLSNLFFCITILSLVLATSQKNFRKQIKFFIKISLFAGLILLVWGSRGILLSGTPLYPSTLGYLNTEWSVPINKIINEANWVYSWARQPFTPWQQVLGNWNWLQPWFHRIMNRNFIDTIYPFTIFLLFFPVNLILFIKIKPHYSQKNRFLLWIIFPPPIVGMIFWFFTAPDPRFSNAVFILLPTTVFICLAVFIREHLKKRTFIAILGIMLLIGNAKLGQWTYVNRLLFTQVSTTAWEPVKKVPLEKRSTNSGLLVYTPVDGDQCWDAPLPCTPYFNKNLRLREKNNLASGFTVSPLQ